MAFSAASPASYVQAEVGGTLSTCQTMQAQLIQTLSKYVQNGWATSGVTSLQKTLDQLTNVIIPALKADNDTLALLSQ